MQAILESHDGFPNSGNSEFGIPNSNSGNSGIPISGFLSDFRFPEKSRVNISVSRAFFFFFFFPLSFVVCRRAAKKKQKNKKKIARWKKKKKNLRCCGVGTRTRRNSELRNWVWFTYGLSGRLLMTVIAWERSVRPRRRYT